MDALADVVFGDEGVGGGFAGDRAVYYDPRNSLLSSVVRRRRGIPLSLAVVYVAVARRLGLPMHVIGSRGHVLVALAPSAHADDARDAPSVAPSRRHVDCAGGALTAGSAPRCSAGGARRPRRRPDASEEERLGAMLPMMEPVQLGVRMLANLANAYEFQSSGRGAFWKEQPRASSPRSPAPAASPAGARGRAPRSSSSRAASRSRSPARRAPSCPTRRRS